MGHKKDRNCCVKSPDTKKAMADVLERHAIIQDAYAKSQNLSAYAPGRQQMQVAKESIHHDELPFEKTREEYYKKNNIPENEDFASHRSSAIESPKGGAVFVPQMTEGQTEETRPSAPEMERGSLVDLDAELGETGEARPSPMDLDDALAVASEPREFFPAKSIDIDAEISGEPRDTAPHGEVIDLDDIERVSEAQTEGQADHLSESSAAPAPKAEKPKRRVPVWERLYGLRNTTRRPRGERTF